MQKGSEHTFHYATLESSLVNFAIKVTKTAWSNLRYQFQKLLGNCIILNL